MLSRQSDIFPIGSLALHPCMRIKMATELISLFQKIGLADSVAKEAAGNKKLGPMLETVIRTVGCLK
jgi:hypothetical protein